jgi:hypothetical protein
MKETPLILPPGKALGCTLRRDLPGTLCSFLPQAYIIPRADWPKFIGKLSLRDAVHDIFDQDGVGSCASEAATQANAIVREQAGLPFVQFSPWFQYHTVSGGRDQGSTVGENVTFLRDVGSCPMELWPRSKGWRNKPPQECYDAAAQYRVSEVYECSNIEEIGSALLRGFPVTFGWNSHSCCLVELTGTNSAIYANSWDESWGDSGFGTINLSSINFGYGAYAFRC